MIEAPNVRRILLVDDDDTFRSVLGTALTRRGHEVSTAATGQEALELVSQTAYEVILLDLRLPDMDGLEVLKQLQEDSSPAGVIVLTGHGTIDTAIQAIRMGAHDYLEKPCSIAKVELTIQKTGQHMALVERQRVLQDGYSPPDVSAGMIGASPAFMELRQLITRIARSDSTTLITGETGVGKEMVATLLHAQSLRNDAPFVIVDCTVLGEEMLRSELFGHEQGAFTGAARRKHGLFEVAHGGTLFLDEVGETSPDTQSKLLRVLETGRFRRVGGNSEIAVDVRVISATNRDLEDAIRRGRFREDLYFRLATLTIRVPPLRERVEDVGLLVEHFTNRFNRCLSLSTRFSAKAVEVMERYAWPGNVRELIHVVEQAMVLTDSDVLHSEDLPPALFGESPAPARTDEKDVPLTLRELQRQHVLAVLQECGGSRVRAAEALQISERNLRRMLKRYESSPGEADVTFENDTDH